MKKNLVLFGAIALIFATLGFYLSSTRQLAPQATETTAVAKLLSQTMPDASGKPQALSQWQGKPLVVNFWATWCAPCVDEMPELSALQPELTPAKIQILGIGIDSGVNIAEFATKYKITYPLYVGGMDATELSRQLGNQAGGLPFTVIIGSDGRVRKTYLGRLKMQELKNDLKAL
ncbi:MAG: TlpA disulfide reductase family protein [Bacillota bacterium]